LLLLLLLLQVDGQPVAVEVDGSHHYTNSTPHIPLSEVLVRRRLLQVGVSFGTSAAVLRHVRLRTGLAQLYCLLKCVCAEKT
jgi:hypothetical protein